MNDSVEFFHFLTTVRASHVTEKNIAKYSQRKNTNPG